MFTRADTPAREPPLAFLARYLMHCVKILTASYLNLHAQARLHMIHRLMNPTSKTYRAIAIRKQARLISSRPSDLPARRCPSV